MGLHSVGPVVDIVGSICYNMSKDQEQYYQELLEFAYGVAEQVRSLMNRAYILGVSADS